MARRTATFTARLFWPCLLVAGLRAPALATIADDLCLSTDAVCVLQKDKAIEPGSVLDFQARPVILKRGTTLDVGPFAMTLKAASLTLEPGAALLARGLRVAPAGGTITVVVTGDIHLQATGNTRARIDVSASDAGGTLDLTAGGALDIAGVLAAQATSGGSGGTITATSGGTLSVADGAELRASGGLLDDGGTVTLASTAAGIILGGPIDASGSAGGEIELDALGDISTAPAARLDASAVGDDGDGGPITLHAGGSLVVAGPIVASAVEGGAIGGGTVMLTADHGSITLAAPVNAAGAPPDVDGGEVDLKAALDVTQTAAIVVRTPGADATAGSVDLAAGRNLAIGPVDLGGNGSGGELDASAGGAATIAGEVSADGDGNGGLLAISAPDLTVHGSAHANGTAGSFGGSIMLTACTLTVDGTGVLAATGDTGTILLQASGSMVLAGGSAVSAATAPRLEYLDVPPLLSGTVAPPPVLASHPTPPLTPCAGAATCGNHQPDPGESCDDGNLASCDGCSSTCQIEACGNGTLDCHEQCDDGNTVDGDGCDHDCTRTACGNGIQTAGEECDDGNTTACDGCSPTCHRETCGNGVLECAEACDAGPANGTPGSGCAADCTLVPPPACGDGVVDVTAGEECDDGNTTPCDGCSADCRIERCGDNIAECGEQCDDANTEACDGCNPACHVERCGNGTVDCHEECDDGNTVDGDGCDSNCTTTRCGNGVTTPPEQCDDGNLNDNDACDTSCRRRVPCGGGNSCIPCAADTDCDPNGRCAGQQCAGNFCTAVAPFSCDDGVAGTADRCVLDGAGQPACVHACLRDAACDDADACNGAERCDAGTCRAGSPPGGFTGAGCSLDAVDAAVSATTGLRKKVQKHLVALAHGVRGPLAKAQKAAAAGKTAREVRQLRKAEAALAALERYVGRGQLHRTLPDTLVDQLLPSVTVASDAVMALRAGLTH